MDLFKQAEGALQGQEGQDILKQAEGLVSGGQDSSKPTESSSTTGDAKPTTGDAKPTTGSAGSEKTDYKEVYGSAQTLFQGIQDKMAGKSDVSNEQLATSADDILKAAKNSGLDKDNQYGQYFDKAQTFLDKYKSEGGTTGTGGAPKGDATSAPTKTDTDAPTKTDTDAPTKTDPTS